MVIVGMFEKNRYCFDGKIFSKAHTCTLLKIFIIKQFLKSSFCIKVTILKPNY